MKIFRMYEGEEGPAEDIIDPDLPIIDTHHHLWPVGSPIADFPVDDFLQQDVLTGHNIVATVFAECMAAYHEGGEEYLRPVGETEYVVRSCPPPTGDAPYIAAGIFGWADLRKPEVAAKTLDAHIEAGQGRFRGVRHNAVWHEDETRFTLGPRRFPRHLLLDETFRRGLAEVCARDLTYDCWMFYGQLDDLARTADAFPDLTIVLDHMGGPVSPEGTSEARAEMLAVWGPAMREVARRPNVNLKIGGMGMTHFGFGFADKRPTSQEVADAWRPYLEIAVEAFGPDRCLAESNFPPDKHSFSYPVFWNAMKRLLQDYSADEKRAMFAGTAKRVYKLDLDLPG